MRLALLSDIHGNLLALEAVLAEIAAQGESDAYWVLGDLAVFGPWPNETVERLRGLPRARFLRGNTDRYLTTGERPPLPGGEAKDPQSWKGVAEALRIRDANFQWTVEQLNYEGYRFLCDLQLQIEEEIPDFGYLLAFHASPLSDEAGIYEETSDEELGTYLRGSEARIFLCGHTHRPLSRKIEGSHILNVGSVGLPLDGDQRAAYLLLDLRGEGYSFHLRRVEYNVQAVIDQLEAIGHPARNWVAQRLKGAGAG